MTRSAAAICSGVSWFLAPTEPWVSTAISSPAAAAAFLSASAAIKVWAIPVGQAVMATMRRPVGAGAALAAGGEGSAATGFCAERCSNPGTRASTSESTAWGSRMARLVETVSVGLPAKGSIST